MNFRNLAGLAILLSAAGFTNAQCTLENSLGNQKGKETRSQLCTPQAEGNLQLALDVSEVSVPTLDGDNALAGVAGSKAFIIYDRDCNLLGTYAPSGNDCGVPYEIDLALDGGPISIGTVNFDVGAPGFEFDFDGNHYNVDNSPCGGCGDLSDGLEAEQGCKCGFYVGPICFAGVCV